MLDEPAVLGNQHLFDQVGMVEEENRSGPESCPDQVAVLAMPARERPQAVAAEFPQVSGEPVLPGAGRTLYLRSRACLRTHADILEKLALNSLATVPSLPTRQEKRHQVAELLRRQGL